MGFLPFYSVQEAELNFAFEDPSVEIDSATVYYLRMLIEECQSRGIDVLLTTVPYAANEESLRGMSYTYKLAEEYGVPYLDAESVAQFLNSKTDFMNSFEDNSHLNVSGTEKFSRFMADYISENYDIPDRRADGRYAVWDSYSEEYYEELDGMVGSAGSAAEIITLLNAGKHPRHGGARLRCDRLRQLYGKHCCHLFPTGMRVSHTEHGGKIAAQNHHRPDCSRKAEGHKHLLLLKFLQEPMNGGF